MKRMVFLLLGAAGPGGGQRRHVDRPARFSTSASKILSGFFGDRFWLTGVENEGGRSTRS
jgi:hypothetical protein